MSGMPFMKRARIHIYIMKYLEIQCSDLASIFFGSDKFTIQSDKAL